MKIKNWATFQHFKGKAPIWIKVYRSVLHKPEWIELSLEAKGLLVELWLLASEDKTLQGQLPTIQQISLILRQPEEKVSKIISQLDQWVDDVVYNEYIDPIYNEYTNDTLEKRQRRDRDREDVEKEGIVKGRKTKNSLQTIPPSLKTKAFDPEEFIASLQNNPAYEGIDLKKESGRMDAWLLAHPPRRKTKMFIVNWLNKLDSGVLPRHNPNLPDLRTREGRTIQAGMQALQELQAERGQSHECRIVNPETH